MYVTSERPAYGEIRALRMAVDSFDAAAAERLGINRTDLHCLDILIQRESAAPSELGAALGLTTGSVTALLDRLDRLDRLGDPLPRSRGPAQVGGAAGAQSRTGCGGDLRPLAQDGFRHVARCTTEQLELLLDFMRSSRELQERHLDRIRS
ncbi:MarR family transcriptional regulator [Streptomyces sp. NBC_01794]|uniref:MarR family transcriptional regulator n=1 Tax=Streptomyces sp. NBC_01794 TaxID=2975942 RepID=UPI003090CFE8|nr:MarR family transcriptional regulator [Streptomyces sp. NBC_01794]